MSDKPLIGVTGPDRGGATAWLMTAFALRRCGARPVRITPARPVPCERLDGLVVGGGTDVDPLQYGQERELAEAAGPRRRIPLLDWLVSLLLTALRLLLARRAPQAYDPDRDQLETGLVRYALYHDLPVLGICRGAQLMNVVLGGSLHRDIGHYYNENVGNVRSILPRKSVIISKNSLLLAVLGRRACRVNALHDQSVDRLGDGLRAVAVEASGVVQAIERPGQRWFVGVQWHPEYMPQSATQRKLFRSLCDCASERLAGER